MIRKAALGLDVARLETEKARAGNLPTVALNGSYGKGHVSGASDQVTRYPSFSGNQTSASVGVTLQMPLFAGYAIQNRIKETLLLEEKSRNDLEAARRAVAHLLWQCRRRGVHREAHGTTRPAPPPQGNPHV